MSKRERLKEINSIMELIYQHGNACYLMGKKGYDAETYDYVSSECDNLEKVIRCELYSMIDRIEQKEKEEV